MGNKDMFRRGPAAPEPAGAPVSVGAVLLCSVAALCVTALVLTAASRAGSAMRLSQAAMDASSGYYSACLAANSDLAEMRSSGPFPCRFEADYEISGVQHLHVSVDINGPDDYEILDWRSVPDASWQPDQTLDVAK